MTHVLRKSVGPFSAGTRVIVISDNDDKTVTVEVIAHEPDKNKGYNYSFEDLVFDIDKHLIVKQRNRVDVIPSVSRKKRRVFLKGLFAGTQSTTATTTASTQTTK